MKAVTLLTLLGLCILGGCTKISTPSPVVNYPSATPRPSATSRPLPTITPSPTNLPGLPIYFDCLPIQPSLPADSNQEGVIALEGEAYAPAYLLDLKTGRRTALPMVDGDDVSGLTVSPDGKYLAYFYRTTGDWRVDPPRLVIATADGQVRKAIWLNARWQALGGWHDNERVRISELSGEMDTLNSLILYDPFADTYERIPPDFPEIYTVYEPGAFRYWGGGFAGSRFVPDPSLELMVYPQPFEEHLRIRVWDRVANKEIASLDHFGIGHGPKWSMNGSHFVIDSSHYDNDTGNFKDELYLVSREGEVERLTYLTEAYASVSIGSYRWSPDGRYLAFFLDLKPEPTSLYPLPDNSLYVFPRLTILELGAKKLTNYCISNPEGVISRAPIWSPDSRHLAVNYSSDSNLYQAVVVDLEEGYAAIIGDNLMPAGWMVSP